MANGTMTAPTPFVQPVANDRLKSGFNNWFWGGIAAATILHFLFFALWPDMQAADEPEVRLERAEWHQARLLRTNRMEVALEHRHVAHVCEYRVAVARAEFHDGRRDSLQVVLVRRGSAPSEDEAGRFPRRLIGNRNVRIEQRHPRIHT